MASSIDERRPLMSSSSGDRSLTSSSRTRSDVDPSDVTSSWSCSQCVRSYVPIEFVLFGYAFSRVFIICLTSFFFFDEACRIVGADRSMDSLKPCTHDTQRTMREAVQKEAVQLNMIGKFCGYLTAVLPTLVMGPATDIYGRRMGFVVPLLGSMASTIVFLFVLGSGASVYFIYIGFVLEGLSGGFGSFFMTAFSAAADVTQPGPQRGLRICILEAVIVLGSALAGFLAGQWRRVGYVQPTMCASGLALLTLLYALWGWPETRQRQDAMEPCPAASGASINAQDEDYHHQPTISTRPSSTSPPPPLHTPSPLVLALTGVKKSWNVYFRPSTTSHPARRPVLGLCFVSFLLTVAVNFSKPTVESVYRMGELCWDAVYESEFDSVWLVAHWLCILLTLYVLQRRLQLGAVSLAIIGCLSAMCAVMLFSLATWPQFSDRLANELVYVSAASGTWARLLIPMLRTLSSSVVHVEEQGALFASYACVELTGAAVFDMAASQVYKATAHLWKGVIFVIMTFFFIIVLILLTTLSLILRRYPDSTIESREGRRSRPEYESFNEN